MKQNLHRSGLARWTLVLALAAAGWWLGAAGIIAQETEDRAPQEGRVAPQAGQYTVISPVRVAFPTRLSLFGRGTFESDDERILFRRYYEKMILPPWTKPPLREPNDDVVGKLRRDLGLASRGDIGRPVYKELCKIILGTLEKYAVDEQFHPETRYNSVLMIGELDIPTTVPFLLGVIKDPKQPEYLKVAALVGMIRQAGHPKKEQLWAANPEAVKAVTAAMLTLVGAAVPKDEKADGVCWMRGQAAEVLGLLGSAGEGGVVAEALRKAMADKSLPISQRCKVAQALGRLDFGGQAIDPRSYLDALLALVSDVLAAESEPSARRLKSNLALVIQAVNDRSRGIRSLAKTPEHDERIRGLAAAIMPLYKDLAKLSGANLRTKVQEAADAMDSLRKAKAKSA